MHIAPDALRAANERVEHNNHATSREDEIELTATVVGLPNTQAHHINNNGSLSDSNARLSSATNLNHVSRAETESSVSDSARSHAGPRALSADGQVSVTAVDSSLIALEEELRIINAEIERRGVLIRGIPVQAWMQSVNTPSRLPVSAPPQPTATRRQANGVNAASHHQLTPLVGRLEPSRDVPSRPLAHPTMAANHSPQRTQLPPLGPHMVPSRPAVTPRRDVEVSNLKLALNRSAVSQGAHSRAIPRRPLIAERRPVGDEPCFICYEDVYHADQADWCRHCGHNSHIECAAEWMLTRSRGGLHVQCGYW